jgi:hypothetical protein
MTGSMADYNKGIKSHNIPSPYGGELAFDDDKTKSLEKAAVLAKEMGILSGKTVTTTVNDFLIDPEKTLAEFPLRPVDYQSSIGFYVSMNGKDDKARRISNGHIYEGYPFPATREQIVDFVKNPPVDTADAYEKIDIFETPKRNYEGKTIVSSDGKRAIMEIFRRKWQPKDPHAPSGEQEYKLDKDSTPDYALDAEYGDGDMPTIKYNTDNEAARELMKNLLDRIPMRSGHRLAGQYDFAVLARSNNPNEQYEDEDIVNNEPLIWLFDYTDDQMVTSTISEQPGSYFPGVVRFIRDHPEMFKEPIDSI